LDGRNQLSYHLATEPKAKKMRAVLGIDAAWTLVQPSGVAVVREEPKGWALVEVASSYQEFCAKADHQLRDAHSIATRIFHPLHKTLEQTSTIVGYVPKKLRPWPSTGGIKMAASAPLNAQERKRARRLEIACRLYEALVAQNLNRGITLCDEAG
jgi:hypothetical protein